MTDIAALTRELSLARGNIRSLLQVVSDATLAQAGQRFDNEAYCALYPDIDAAVRAGVVKSGFAHWREWGAAEGREAPLCDALAPTGERAALLRHNNYEMCLAQQALQPLVQRSGVAVSTVLLYAPRAIVPDSGGLLVLHKLRDMLRQRGVDAHLWLGEAGAPPQNDPFGPYVNGTLDPREAVVIYPEITCGNPLQARHVVRWLLNTPGVFGRPVSFSPDDLLMHHSPFCAADPDPARELCILTYKPPKPSRTAVERAGTCYVVRKGRERPRVPATDDATCLDDAGNDAVQAAFQTHARFYSYDLYTFLAVQAAMAGADSVVIPDPQMSAQRWRQIYRFGLYGVAYGEDEIPRAVATRHLIGPYLQALQRTSEMQVDAFVARLAWLGWWRPAAAARKE